MESVEASQSPIQHINQGIVLGLLNVNKACLIRSEELYHHNDIYLYYLSLPH